MSQCFDTYSTKKRKALLLQTNVCTGLSVINLTINIKCFPVIYYITEIEPRVGSLKKIDNRNANIFIKDLKTK